MASVFTHAFVGVALATAFTGLPRARALAGSIPYLGRSFDAGAVERVLAAGSDVAFAHRDDVVDRAAAALDRGELVGWFHGREEVGPRALGARSLLASPLVPGIRDRINRAKERESFRPVALMVDEGTRHVAFTGPACPCGRGPAQAGEA